MKDTTYRIGDRVSQRRAAKDVPAALLGHDITRITTLMPDDPPLFARDGLPVVVITLIPRPMGVDGRTREARAKKAATPAPTVEG